MFGPSRSYDHTAFRWTDQAWTGRALPGTVLYELHIGTFTPAGTFDAAIERLDYLADLGIDLVEVMPVNAFDGTAGWGYDGVLWGAVHEPYGGPDGFKRFVDACHGRDMGVVLDVVYNHIGPSGAYLDRFGPYFAGENQWGAALNTDGPGSDEVRRYVIDNATGWLRDFHVDGLRLDAVHAIVDHRALTLLEELSAAVDALAAGLRRTLSLIAESDLNDPRLITSREANGYGLTAQWSDDIHHALHVALTGETHGYYKDFAAPEALATTLRSAYFHAGTWSSFRGRTHGRPVDIHRIPGSRFVCYLQDHDQVGNRAQGDRLSASVRPGLLACGAAIVLCSPYTPMIFMGEEWAASTPWQFFASFPDPGLADAVRERAPVGVRGARLGGGGDPRPDLAGHGRAEPAGLEGAVGPRAPLHARALPRADRAAAPASGAGRPTARRVHGGNRAGRTLAGAAPGDPAGGVPPGRRGRQHPPGPAGREGPAGLGRGDPRRARPGDAARVVRRRHDHGR